jgi:CRP-like cAMP-binding protein
VADSDCLFLSAAAFERLLAERPAIARRWLSSVAVRLARSEARLVGLLGGSLAEQAARLLLEEASDGLVPLPQRTLAAMLGLQRPSLNKLLRDFERQGLIELGYRSVRILDLQGLRRRSSGRLTSHAARAEPRRQPCQVPDSHHELGCRPGLSRSVMGWW